MKQIVIVCLLICSFLGIERLCHKATDGFALNKIAYPLDEELIQSSNPYSVEHQHAKNILTTHTFRYLKSGAQCYAFISDDNAYIVKFFKFQHMRIPPWTKHLPLPSMLHRYRDEKLAKKRRIISDLFNSFEIAYRYLKDETGILFLHLRKSQDLNGKITIADKIGIRHTLDLDSTYFVLQLRANLAYDKIDQWMKKGKIAKARNGIRELVALAAKRFEKGIVDKDPDFSTNFGFVNGRATQIDIGRFSKKPGRYDPKEGQCEIMRITRPFRKWLQENYEELVEVLDEECQKFSHDQNSQ